MWWIFERNYPTQCRYAGKWNSKPAMVTNMHCHGVVWKICSNSHFSSLYLCMCMSMRLCAWACVCVCVRLQMRKIGRKSDELSHIWKPSVVQWFMGLITESIRTPEVLLFFCVSWDDRNTTTKQPTWLHPILTQKPIHPVLAHIWYCMWTYVHVMHSNVGSVCNCKHFPSKTNTITNYMLTLKICKTGTVRLFMCF